MHSKLLGFLAVSTIALNGCGLLGEKNPPQGNSNVSATGCLNESKDLVTRYMRGTMSQTQWRSAFDCINQSLDFFTDFVRGSTADSYTQGDMYTLVSKFLITNGKVRKDLMKGAFNLKSALFGGDVREFKKEEIELLKTSLNRLRDITSDLIPYLQLRQNPGATLEQILEIAPAFKRAGDQLADFINTLPTNDMSSSAMDLLFKELTYTLDLEEISDLGEKVSIAKWLMFNSRRDAFETQDWANVFKNAFGLGGLLFALKVAQGDDPEADRAQIFKRLTNDYRFREFFWELVQMARPYIDESLTRHGGSTPLPLFDHIIDELPAGILDNVPKDDLKKVIRPFVLRLLQSETGLGVDRRVVDSLYGLVEDLVKKQGMVDRFYEATGMNPVSVTFEVLRTNLTLYEDSLTGQDRTRFTHIKNLLLDHPPMMQDTGFVRYENGLGYSKVQNQMIPAFESILKFVQRSYGSAPDYFLEADFVAFFADYTDVLFAFQMIDRTVARFGEKRFSDLDLFTPIGNGDQRATFKEVIQYALMLVSAGKLNGNMKREIWAQCPLDTELDLMNSRWISPDCFRRNFHGRLDYWLEQFPRMRTYWLTLNETEKALAMKWLEHGARRNGLGDEKFGSYDFQSMAVILHYVESLFNRFDGNSNEVLSKTEVNKAYDLFKILLKKEVREMANIDLNNDWLLKGIFSYIVRYRKMPELKGLSNITHFGWWLVIYGLPTTNYTADRLGIFNIVCLLAAPESEERAAMTKTICVP